MISLDYSIVRHTGNRKRIIVIINMEEWIIFNGYLQEEDMKKIGRERWKVVFG